MTILKNTTELSSDFIRTLLSENARELSAARADAALLARLQSAPAAIIRLQAEGAELTKALDNTLSQEGSAAKDKRKASVRNLNIVTVMPDRENSALKAAFKITWEAPAYDSGTRQSEWKLHSADGFDALDDRVYSYMMEFKPELIPAVIMELAPRDPQLAMERFFFAKRKGYVSLST